MKTRRLNIKDDIIMRLQKIRETLAGVILLGFRPGKQAPCRKDSLEAILGSCAKNGVCLLFTSRSWKRIYADNPFRKRYFKLIKNLFHLF